MIVTESGRPLEGLELLLVESDAWQLNPQEFTTPGRTDPSGRAVFFGTVGKRIRLRFRDLAPRGLVLPATVGNLNRTGMGFPELRIALAPDAVTPLEIEVARAGALEVHVVGWEAGAEPFPYASPSGQLEALAPDVVDRFHQPKVEGSVLRFESLPPGRYRLSQRWVKARAFPAQEVEIEAGETRRLEVMVAPVEVRPLRIQARSKATGAALKIPIAYSLHRLKEATDTFDMSEAQQRGVTDAAGVARVSVNPGRYSLLCRIASRASRTVHLFGSAAPMEVRQILSVSEGGAIEPNPVALDLGIEGPIVRVLIRPTRGSGSLSGAYQLRTYTRDGRPRYQPVSFSGGDEVEVYVDIGAMERSARLEVGQYVAPEFLVFGSVRLGTEPVTLEVNLTH